MELKSKLYDVIMGMAIGEALGTPYRGLEKGEFVCGGMVADKSMSYSAGSYGKITNDAIYICDILEKANDFLKSYEYFELFDKLQIKSVASLAPLASTKYVTNPESWMELNEALMDAFGEFSDSYLYLSIIGQILYNNTYEEIENLILGTINCSYLADLFEIDIIVETKRDAFRAALWCFIHTDNFKDCLLRAVNLGGRSSETAAIVGSIAGGHYGVDAIPENWMEALRDKEAINDIWHA